MTQYLRGEARARFVADVVERYEAGDSIRAICRATGYSYTAIRDILVAQHVQLRPRGHRRSGR